MPLTFVAFLVHHGLRKDQHVVGKRAPRGSVEKVGSIEGFLVPNVSAIPPLPDQEITK